MPSWLLLVALLVVWLLWGIAAVFGRAVDDKRRGIPEGQRGGVSFAPVIPVCPLVFWGIALVVNLVVDPWGTLIVGAFHAVLAVLFVISIGRNTWQYCSVDNPGESDAPADRPRE
jgi:hypothetical protein